MADVFSLADKDNDKTLYQIENELDDFWNIIELEIQAIKDEGTRLDASEWRDT